MKITSPLIAIVACLAAGSCLADEWATLSGVSDRVTLKSGQTAMIAAVSGQVTVRYEKPGGHCNWFRLRSENRDNQAIYVSNQRRYDAVVSNSLPFPLAGPAVVSLTTPGVASMRIVDRAPAPTGAKLARR